jgi:UDP-N-acetylmuramoyl-tripeptide--D-alanyl-D-alanine ligase
MASAAIDAGIAASSVRYFEKSDEAAPVVVETIRPGDLVLVKGSRGTRTDVVVDRLVAERG